MRARHRPAKCVPLNSVLIRQRQPNNNDAGGVWLPSRAPVAQRDRVCCDSLCVRVTRNAKSLCVARTRCEPSGVTRVRASDKNTRLPCAAATRAVCFTVVFPLVHGARHDEHDDVASNFSLAAWASIVRCLHAARGNIRRRARPAAVGRGKAFLSVSSFAVLLRARGEERRSGRRRSLCLAAHTRKVERSAWGRESLRGCDRLCETVSTLATSPITATPPWSVRSGIPRRGLRAIPCPLWQKHAQQVLLLRRMHAPPCGTDPRDRTSDGTLLRLRTAAMTL